MKKRVKVCTIEVYSEKTRLVSNISEKKSAEETFVGNKNRVLHDVKNFLKDASFYNVTARKPMVFRPWDEWR